MPDSSSPDEHYDPSKDIPAGESGGISWHSWGDAAFDLAVQKGCPVFLYIERTGSRACHLMEQECFSNRTIADALNGLYVCIKVNRDDRPDLDRVYQTALQLLTQEPGGWPLTLFLTPENRMPFFGGTYFPAHASGALPGFADVLQQLRAYFGSGRETIASQNQFLLSQFDVLTSPLQDCGPLSRDAIVDARRLLETSFDATNGGFGPAPKEPPVLAINHLFRHWEASQHADTPDLKALYIAALTLTRMAECGLNDVVAGGFFSHCIDATWSVPNFDKPLGINGLLVECYAQAAIATGEDLFAHTAKSTANWLLETMVSADGSFLGGMTPDPALRPENFYLWTFATLQEILSDTELRVLRSRVGLGDSEQERIAPLHLQARQPWNKVAEELGLSIAEAKCEFERGLSKLRNVRSRRSGIRVDERSRILYNALAIRGLAVAGRVLGIRNYVDAARIAFSHACDRLGKNQQCVVLDDVAALLLAAIELLQCTWTAEVFGRANELSARLMHQFYDSSHGCFWATERDRPKLVWRPRWQADEGLPSGSGMAALGLLRWGHITGDRAAVTAATRAITGVSSLMQTDPVHHLTLLDALDECIKPSTLVILRGPEPVTLRWQQELARLYAPKRLVFAWQDNDQNLPQTARLMPTRARGIAYLWRGNEWQGAITDFPELIRRLRDGITFVEE